MPMMAAPHHVVHPASPASVTPLRAALAPALPPGATVPVRIHRAPEGVIAVYDPTANSRADVWQLLRSVFGDLLDVTPAVAAT